jgi:hypothetical protein
VNYRERVPDEPPAGEEPLTWATYVRAAINLGGLFVIIACAIFMIGLSIHDAGVTRELNREQACQSTPGSCGASVIASGEDTVNGDGTVISNGIDDQVAKNQWYICTPYGWQQITTSVPVHIWWVPGAVISPLVPGPYVLGPFSPAQTFSAPWDALPKARCGR